MGAGQRAGRGAGLAAAVPPDTWCPPAAGVPGQGGCSGRPRPDRTRRDRTGRDAGGAATSEHSRALRPPPGPRKEPPKAEMEPARPLQAWGTPGTPDPPPRGPTTLSRHFLLGGSRGGVLEKEEARDLQRRLLTSAPGPHQPDVCIACLTAVAQEAAGTDPRSSLPSSPPIEPPECRPSSHPQPQQVSPTGPAGP